MEIKIEDLIPKKRTLEYNGQVIEFKVPDTEDSINLISLLTQFEKLTIIGNETFYEVLSKSTGIPIEVLKQTSPGFRTKALSVLLELIDLDFFIDGFLGISEVIKKLQEKVPETGQPILISGQK